MVFLIFIVKNQWNFQETWPTNRIIHELLGRIYNNRCSQNIFPVLVVNRSLPQQSIQEELLKMIPNILSTSNVLHIALLVYLRFIAITRPLCYEDTHRRHHNKSPVFIWVLSIVANFFTPLALCLDSPEGHLGIILFILHTFHTFHTSHTSPPTALLLSNPPSFPHISHVSLPR